MIIQVGQEPARNIRFKLTSGEQRNHEAVGLTRNFDDHSDFEELRPLRNIEFCCQGFSLNTKRLRDIPTDPGFYGSCILRCAILGLAIWGLDIAERALRRVETTMVSRTPTCWCGDTDEQALAMGCRYDHIAVDWLPDSCIDNELVRAFDRSGPGPDGSWLYYEMVEPDESTQDPELVPINSTEIDEFAKVGKEYWATREWHILHCLFIWRKQFRASYGSLMVEPWNNDEEHVLHCSDYIMTTVRGKLGKDAVDTVIPGVNRHPR